MKKSTPSEKKTALLKLAQTGAVRPRSTDAIGAALRRYTRETGKYDPLFDKEIKRLRPDWFTSKR